MDVAAIELKVRSRRIGVQDFGKLERSGRTAKLVWGWAAVEDFGQCGTGSGC
jgi:hypothetical protein